MIRIGFELELLSPFHLSDVRSDLRKLFPATGRRYYDQIQVVPDGSVRDEHHSIYKYWGQEIVTPPWPVKEALRNLYGLFKWMEVTRGITNNKCGLHVNVGFSDGVPRKIDPAKLVLLSDEIRYLRQFRRLTNCFTVPVLQEYALNAEEGESLSDWLDYWTDHHHAVSLEKLDHEKGRGWAEFRMIGNTNYHLRYDEVKEAILHCVRAVEDSTTSRRNNLYKKRLRDLEDLTSSLHSGKIARSQVTKQLVKKVSE